MQERIRALLVDDDQGDFEMARAMVAEIEAEEVTLDWVATFEEGLDALESEAFDVYIVDYFLEDHTGMDLLLAARERGIRAPVIMLTGRGNRAVDVQAMNAGAADYLVKGKIDPELLERSIRFALERTRAEEDLRASQARFEAVFQEADRPIAVLGADGVILETNDSFDEVFPQFDSGGTPTLIDLAVPEERARILGVVQKLTRGEMERHSDDHRFISSNGEIRLRARIRPVLTGSGTVDQLVIFFEGDRGG